MIRVLPSLALFRAEAHADQRIVGITRNGLPNFTLSQAQDSTTPLLATAADANSILALRGVV